MSPLGTATVIQGDARHLPLPDSSVDLVCTSPPYFALRSYQDQCRSCDGTGEAKAPDSYRVKTCSGCGETTSRVKCHNGCGVPMKWTKPDAPTGEQCHECNGTGRGHYDGQIGSENTSQQWLENLWECTAEMVRVLKPEGSIFINLGDKYAQDTERSRHGEGNRQTTQDGGLTRGSYLGQTVTLGRRDNGGTPRKSLMGLPWRYAIGCIDRLGLILRAEIIWAKPNGLPESVTDRVRRSHESWFHFVKQPRYYSAVDEIREDYTASSVERARYTTDKAMKGRMLGSPTDKRDNATPGWDVSPLGKLPGSVWTIPTEPLQVPPHLGVDHFAAYPTEWPRRIITGWTPAGICSECGQGRRPVVEPTEHYAQLLGTAAVNHRQDATHGKHRWRSGSFSGDLTGYVCACPPGRSGPQAPTRPSVIVDPFGGTGTTALVAKALGRHGITIDLSLDYSRLAQWRVNNPGELAKAAQVPKPPPVIDGQMSLLDGGAA